MKALTYIGAAAAGALLAWSVEHYRLSAELADVRRDHAEQLLVIAARNATKLEQATRKAESLQQQIADIDAHYTQELNDAQANADRLRDAVDSGAKRLHILAKRPTHCPAVPGTTDDTSLGDGTTIELAPAARRAYFNLRAGVTSDTAKLAACQGILAAITHGAD